MMNSVVVQRTSKGWTWTQVSRNGAVSACAPLVYENKAGAKRGGMNQVAKLKRAKLVVRDA